MQISALVTMVNEQLAGERLTYDKMKPHLDAAIDYINTRLNATFPVFSELPAGTTEYNLFPDRYLRTVVVPGAAWHFFVVDEEGINTAEQFQLSYEQGMFYMVRDYLTAVPLLYQGPQTGMDFDSEAETGKRGLEYYGPTEL